MKILYISTPAYADCDFPLIKAFQEKGIDIVYIITIGPFNRRSTLIDIQKPYRRVGIYPASEFKELQVFQDYMDMRNVYISYRNGRNILAPSTWIENYRLKKFVKKQKFDVIHTDDYYRGFRNWIYKLGAKIIVSHHDPFPHSGEHFRNEVKVYSSVIRKSQGAVLLNKNQLTEFCDFYNISPNDVLINRLGVYDNIRSFVPNTIQQRHHNILFFGRISQYKGIEYLCKAMIKVHNVIPDATLTIAGSGRMYFDIGPYKKLDYIEFRNYFIGLEELACLLSQCDISVCPYTDATQSGVIMTSYSLGKPVIATNVGGLPEMIEDGKTGYLVPPKNSDELATAIIKILKDENARNVMSNYIVSEYYTGSKSWPKIADKYIKYYERILERKI